VKISICLTNFNRDRLLFEAVSNVLMDDRVDEIVISDDASDPKIYQSVLWQFKEFAKVKIFQNQKNVDCYQNKALSLSKASNDWCILFDSDNVISKGYIDRIEGLTEGGLNDNTIYTPSFAMPHFDFTNVAGVNITKANIGGLIINDRVQTMLNAANYFVNRHKWLEIFDLDTDPVTSDSIYMAYRWLKAGYSIYVVPDLSYQHRVNNHGTEESSHYGKNVRRTPHGFHQNIVDKLKAMR